MANSEHLGILKQGVETWNKWMEYKYNGRPGGRKEPDLRNLDSSFLKEFDFSRLIENDYPHPGEINDLFKDYKNGALSDDQIRLGWKNLDNINLFHADLSGADLSGISLKNATLNNVNFTKANLNNADLNGASLAYANLTGVSLVSSNLSNTNLTWANMTEADLNGANLERAIFVETILERANLSDCHVYGLSAWKLHAKDSMQTNLVITPYSEPSITVDNLEVAQFMYLLINNENIRNAIDTITSKVVLILGRFTAERKEILDSIRKELRKKNYLPVLFDFEKPKSRDLTETISTLAHMSRFIIADLTDAKSIPQELQRIIPDLPNVPVQPILLQDEAEYAMFEHFKYYPWVLETYTYKNSEQLINSLILKVIEPAESKILEIKSKE